jgi:hypothetical protein
VCVLEGGVDRSPSSFSQINSNTSMSAFAGAKMSGASLTTGREMHRHLKLIGGLGSAMITLALGASIVLHHFRQQFGLNDVIGWKQLMIQPGMITTLIDLLVGVMFFSAWVCFRENFKENKCKCLLWIFVFIMTGNIGTGIYLFKAAIQSAGDYESLLFGNRRFEFHH